ncbi:hypothetical protein BC826DRAFT_970746 [Russula brevipes]|nr:hypothetical protein BC826DRAFT_970746 [Russula brevipes]
MVYTTPPIHPITEEREPTQERVIQPTVLYLRVSTPEAGGHSPKARDMCSGGNCGSPFASKFRASAHSSLKLSCRPHFTHKLVFLDLCIQPTTLATISCSVARPWSRTQVVFHAPESSPEPDMMDVDMDDAPDTVATIPQEGDVALSRPGGANHMAPIFDAAFPHGDRRDFLGPGPGLVQPSAHVGVHGSWQPTLAHPSPSRAEISFPPARYEQVAGRHVEHREATNGRTRPIHRQEQPVLQGHLEWVPVREAVPEEVSSSCWASGKKISAHEESIGDAETESAPTGALGRVNTSLTAEERKRSTRGLHEPRARAMEVASVAMRKGGIEIWGSYDWHHRDGKGQHRPLVGLLRPYRLHHPCRRPVTVTRGGN